MSDDESYDFTHDPEFKAWAAQVHAHVLPKLSGSALTVSLVPRGETDIKFAVELGLSIMLDKPIIAVVQEGATVPGKLRQVADAIVEIDFTDPERSAIAQRLLAEKIAEITGDDDDDDELGEG